MAVARYTTTADILTSSAVSSRSPRTAAMTEAITLVTLDETNQPAECQVYYTSKVDYFEPPEPTCIGRLSNWITSKLEAAFYKLGYNVARRPWLTITITLVICGLSAIGMRNFKQTTDDAKLWVPKSSRVLPEKKWSEDMFPEDTRFTSIIVTAPNVLSPWAINTMFDMYLYSLTFGKDGPVTYKTMCVKVGSICHVTSLLELWGYSEPTIRTLTLNDILEAVNTPTKYSPVYGTEFSVDQLLGGVRRDKHGSISGAESVRMVWTLHRKPEWESYALDWEMKMIDMANTQKPHVYTTYVYATRSFNDEGYGAVNADVSLLTAGFILVFVFVILVLGRFNLVEHKLYISLLGILSIGLAILFSYGLAMYFGFLYGPIHAVMPFLLLGIGVDDMFVVIGAWYNLKESDQQRPLEERVALSLKHAGVSITITSITDIVAFGIGGSTVIPALSAFCVYAALGILGLYGLVSTFFVACLTLDQRRVQQSKDAILFCYTHRDYVPNKFSQLNIIPMFMEKIYAPNLLKLSCKISVMVITVALTSVNIWSFTRLRQDFNLYEYIPADSYARAYINTQQVFYPDRGYDSAIYCDGMSYYDNRDKLERMFSAVDFDPYIQKGSTTVWYRGFLNYLRTTSDPIVIAQLDSERWPQTSRQFDQLLVYFLRQREGQSYGQYIKFDQSFPPKVKGSFIPLVHTRQENAAGDIDAMESLRKILDNAALDGGRCFCYGFKYLNNETNKVLKGELYRNLALAAVCVFLVTLVLIANLWASFLVFSCVAFTVIDVIGTLQFWGVTIDTASSILLILSVGLAIDYSAHVGHTFMTIAGPKDERTKQTLIQIGPAVFSGGVSTFLAFVLLANSSSYGFVLFFRVFMTVVIFGLFHGLVYLPVILSWIGPQPYPTADPLPAREATPVDQKHPPEVVLEEQREKLIAADTTHMNGFVRSDREQLPPKPRDTEPAVEDRATLISVHIPCDMPNPVQSIDKKPGEELSRRNQCEDESTGLEDHTEMVPVDTELAGSEVHCKPRSSETELTGAAIESHSDESEFIDHTATVTHDQEPCLDETKLTEHSTSVLQEDR